MRRRTVVALNAGEMQISRSRAFLVFLLWFAARLARLRGGTSVWLGASVLPTADPLMRAVYRLAARDVSVVQWREAGSLQTGGPRPVGPDWAFATGTPTAHWDLTGRDVAAFVMRSDREPPTAIWREWARSLVATHGLKPVFVVQVEIDDVLAQELAAGLGGEVLTWRPGVPHNDQEARVRQLFRHARIAVGDRLHGLIVAATEGAVPIGWVDTSNGKVASHFDAAGMPYVGEFEGARFTDPPPDLTPERLAELVAALPVEIDACRSSLTATTAGLKSDRSGRSHADRDGELLRPGPRRRRPDRRTMLLTPN
jgi:hypothetical protein